MRIRPLQPSRTAHLSVALLLVGCACGLYLPTLSSPFIFDDLPAIVDNAQVRKLWPLTEAMTPAPDLPTSSRPLVALSFSINYALGGLDVRGYHALNLALHALNALLVYALALTLLRSRQLPDWTREAAWPLAAATALVWCVHPLVSESVAYVTQRTELMAAGFYLSALLCAARAFDEPARPLWQLLACCAAVLGLGCKETAATIVLAVLCLDWLTSKSSLLALFRARPVLYLGLALQLALAVAMVSAAPYKYAGIGFEDGVSGLQWLATQGGVIVLYLARVLWPHPLSISYNFPIALELTRYWPQVALVAVLFVATLAWATRRTLSAFPALFCFIYLGPSSSIVPMVTEVVAERRMYLCVAALSVYAVVLAYASLLRVRVSPRVGGVLLASVVLGLAARTAARVADYASAPEIWRAALALDASNPQARLGLAMALHAAGERGEARAVARPVTEWRREYPGARDWSARAYLLLGSWEEAEGRPRAALALYDTIDRDSPERAAALVEGGRVLLRLGDARAAAQRLQEAIGLGRAGASEEHNLGVALSLSGQYAPAVEHFARAYALDPSTPRSVEALALALQAQGRLNEAASVLQELLQRWPDDARALARLGTVLVALGQSESGLRSLDRAVALGSSGAETQLARCDAMARLGLVEQALRACDRALSIAPTDARLRGERDRIVSSLGAR